MKRTFAFIILVSFLLPSCNSVPPTSTTTEHLSVQYSAASIPWLTSLYNCADGNVITTKQRGTKFLDIQSATIIIRIGRPDQPTDFAYQIAKDDLLVIANMKNLSNKLTLDQVNELFTGQIQNWKSINGKDAQVQTWIFPSGEDIQGIFNQTVLHGSPVVATAHLATSPDEMGQAVQKDVNAIGIINKHWKTENVESVYTVATNLPVLAISQSKPQGFLSQIITCMQSEVK